MMATLKGPIELEATCDCGQDLYGVSDEWETVCPKCGKVWTVLVVLQEERNP